MRRAGTVRTCSMGFYEFSRGSPNIVWQGEWIDARGMTLSYIEEKELEI